MDFLIQNFDRIIWAVSLAVTALGFFFALRNDILALKSDINHIRENQRALAEAFTQLGTILTKVAVQDARIQMIEKKIDELSHGQGYVKVRN